MARSETYRSTLEASGATFVEWRGAEVVDHFGDPEAEYRAIREGIAVADRSERETVVAEGVDVVPLLQGLVLGDVYTLATEGSGQLNAAVNVKGRYVTELRLLHVPELLLIDFEPGMIAEGAVSHFKRQVINEDAKFRDRSEKSAKLLVAGPDAADWLGAHGEWANGAPGTLGEYDGTWGLMSGVEVIVQQLPTFGGPAFELLVDASEAHELWETLAEAGRPVGHEALERARIEAGTPRWGVELHEKVIPLEAGMSWMVSFDKGCYLGQEIIARLDTLGTPAKELRALDLGEVDPPEAGTPVTSGEKNVGEVIAAVRTGSGGSIAHAFIKRKYNEPGMKVDVDGVEATVRQPGFARSEPSVPKSSAFTA